MSSTHTQGTWTVHKNHPELMPVLVVRCNGQVIATVPGFDISPSEMEANASLIAAAPEHLALLEEAVGYGAKLFEQDEPVEAVDLVEWFAEWRRRTKATCEPCSPGRERRPRRADP